MRVGTRTLGVHIGTSLEGLAAEGILAIIIKILNMHPQRLSNFASGHVSHSHTGRCAGCCKDRDSCCQDAAH